MTEPTPDTDRQTRRDAIQDLLTRIGRGRAGADIAVHLSNYVNAELADADQAREQLAAARAGDGKRRTASDVLVQHDVIRKALCDALDAGYHLNWQQLVDTAQRSHAANAEWQAEAEQRRLALAEALGCPNTATWQHLTTYARQTQVSIRRLEAGIETERCRQDAARQGEAEAVRARAAAERDTKIYRGRLDRLGEGYTEQRARAERAEATLTAVRKAVADAKACGGEDTGCTVDHRDIITDLIDNGPAALADPQPATAEPDDTSPASPVYNLVSYIIERQWADASRTTDEIHADIEPLLAAIRAGSEPKPREVCCVCGCPDVTYRNCNDQPFCCRCAECCDPPKLCGHGCKPPASEVLAAACGPEALWDAAQTEREQPAEPLLRGDPPGIHIHLSVTPAQIAAAITPAQIEAALRRIRCTDRAMPGHLL